MENRRWVCWDACWSVYPGGRKLDNAFVTLRIVWPDREFTGLIYRAPAQLNAAGGGFMCNSRAIYVWCYDERYALDADAVARATQRACTEIFKLCTLEIRVDVYR